jgi:Uma2 family endonuclease
MMSRPAEPQVHLWTRQEYYKMSQAGLFEQKRVELIEGQVIEMSPMSSLHATAVALVGKVLDQTFGNAYHIRNQTPLHAGERSEPEPDIAVVTGSIRDYAHHHPTTAVLVVEVSDRSLNFDRVEKASLYAKVGISDYWIVNLFDRQLEVYRQPIADSSAVFGFRYADVTRLSSGDLVAPLAVPQSHISVGDLLP